MYSAKAFALIIALSSTSAAYGAVVIDATATSPTLIGTFGPGTYSFSTAGVVSLQGPIGSGFDLNADGIPLPGSVSDPRYANFNPNGSDMADGMFGPAGAGINFGSLAGTFTSDGSSGYFRIGTSQTLTFAATTTVYGLVNDSFASNNAGSFSVSAAPVPEPATWAMMLAGFGAVGYSVRRRRATYGRIQAI